MHETFVEHWEKVFWSGWLHNKMVALSYAWQFNFQWGMKQARNQGGGRRGASLQNFLSPWKNVLGIV